LVVRVVSATYEPTQSEAKMSNDVFDDANNLVSHSAPMINRISIAIQQIIL
jgi:hypothetical protein